jgi:outer membrane lipoprotein-sorting protein
MKVLNILIFTITVFYAQVFDFNSYEANFIQTITNNTNNIIKYTGKIYVQNNSNILWQYLKPVAKSVYIIGKKVYIEEPELEQVIISNIHKELNLFNIINNSTKIKENIFQNSINNITYTIKIKDKKLISINYIDEIDNKIEILFLNGLKDYPLEKGLFDYVPPFYYDIIKN